MQKTNDNQQFKYDDSIWYLVAECSLGEAAFGEEMAANLTAELLFQAMRELNTPAESVKRIVETITETVRVPRSPFNNLSLPNLPVHIYLFCTNHPISGMHPSCDQTNGGWGYYVIERGKDLPCSSCQENDREIELYLYKEG